jgi:hypothetical protein
MVAIATIGEVYPQTRSLAKKEDATDFEERYSASVQRFK